MEKIDFLQQTKDLYRNRPAYLSVVKIAEETGLGIPWLSAFSRCENATVKHVNLLHNYLVDKINEARNSALN